MFYEQEQQAKTLYERLAAIFAPSDYPTTLSIKGRGGHWNCFVGRGTRECVIDCFGHMKYAISFESNTITEAMGRTEQEDELILAICDWLQGHTVSQLYQSFAFVDREKRFLEHFWDFTIHTYPDLQHCATIRLDQHYGDFFDLWFITSTRVCKLNFYGQNQFPTCTFFWHDANMFNVIIFDIMILSLLVKRWLCDFAMPSALKQEFDWLDIGKLASYYEAGRGIEGEFVVSWDKIELFYRDFARVPDMIAQMRMAGFDKTLRVGQSLYTFIVSRARRHGLRSDQPHITFDFSPDSMRVWVHFDKVREVSFASIEYNSEVEALLKELEQYPIE